MNFRSFLEFIAASLSSGLYSLACLFFSSSFPFSFRPLTLSVTPHLLFFSLPFLISINRGLWLSCRCLPAWLTLFVWLKRLNDTVTVSALLYKKNAHTQVCILKANWNNSLKWQWFIFWVVFFSLAYFLVQRLSGTV